MYCHLVVRQGLVWLYFYNNTRRKSKCVLLMYIGQIKTSSSVDRSFVCCSESFDRHMEPHNSRFAKIRGARFAPPMGAMPHPTLCADGPCENFQKRFSVHRKVQKSISKTWIRKQARSRIRRKKCSGDDTTWEKKKRKSEGEGSGMDCVNRYKISEQQNTKSMARGRLIGGKYKTVMPSGD